ncbi:MAG TPA: HAMP domain-containing histidine kinase [Firmicutes bacterium]|nr:HAMP domain-containing histidine kinase [Bacillota bacterium]
MQLKNRLIAFLQVWRSPSAAWGAACLGLGFLMPLLIDQQDFGVLTAIKAAIFGEDGGRLLLTALRLVMLNTIRIVPVYYGAFLIGEAALQSGAGPWRRRIGYILPIGLIPVFYRMIQNIYAVEYDFGVPALLALCSLLVLHQISLHQHSARNRSILLMIMLHAVQWPDMAPSLTDYGFGRGELSRSIKIAADFLQVNDVLNIWSLLMAFFLIALTLLIGKFMVDATQHMALLEETRQREVAVERALREQLAARTTRETQSLVHDLKTPLTAIEGLAGLIQMMAHEQATDSGRAIKKHAEAIEHAAERMRAMVSEMLNPQPAQIISLGELVEYVRAQMPGQRNYVKFYVENPHALLRVNRIRLARALVNIISNAIESGTRQPVAVRAWAENGTIQVMVADSGSGISSETLDRIWQAGYSTKGGSGLGLPFARTVIEVDHHGSIQVDTVPETGTTITVTLQQASPADAGCKAE